MERRLCRTLPVSRPDRPLRRRPSCEPFACQRFLAAGEELEPRLRGGGQDGPAPPDEGGAPTEFLFVEKGDVDVGEFPPFEFEAGEEGDADARRHKGHDEIKLAAAQALIELQPTLAADGLDAVVEQEALLEADEGVVCQFIHFEAFAIGEGMIRGHDDHERFVPNLEPRKIRRDGEKGDGKIEIPRKHHRFQRGAALFLKRDVDAGVKLAVFGEQIREQDAAGDRGKTNAEHAFFELVQGGDVGFERLEFFEGC